MEVFPFLQELKKEGIEIGVTPNFGSIEIALRGEKADEMTIALQKRFPTFFLGEKKIEEAVHEALNEKKAKLAFAESCTGGAMAAKIVSVPGASLFFQGSIVAYANSWKERFLHVRRDTLDKEGAVSKKVAIEMIEGLFGESDIDYAVAVSGLLGEERAMVYFAIGKKGEGIDVGKLKAPSDRKEGIEFTVQTALGALWRRVVHNAWTFS